MRKLLGAIRRRLSELRLPDWRYRDSNVSLRPVEGTARHMVELEKADALAAYQHNLSTVTALLEAGNIEYFLEAGTWGQSPQLGLTRTSAQSLIDSLVGQRGQAPVYVRFNTPGGSAEILLAKSIPSPSPKAMLDVGFAVFTFFRNPTTGRKFGAEYGCNIQVWAEDEEGDLRNDTPRAGETNVLALSDRQATTSIMAHGLPIRTYKGFEETRIFEVGFPVDVVYLWVDGSDPAWQDRRSARLGKSPEDHSQEATLANRFRQFDELRYSLRSLERYAPWVNNIYLVTDQQRPEWLSETGTNLKVIDHREILPESALPTFNSHPLTASLHNIPGIADHFILLNDDMLFGRPTPPDRFFQSNGVARFFVSRTLINARPGSAHEWARLHSCDVIQKATGFRPTHVLKHAPYSFNRGLLAEIESELTTEWTTTIHSPFRSPTDVVPEYVHHYLGYSRQIAVPAAIDYRYFGFGLPGSTSKLATYQRSQPGEVLCINDLGTDSDAHSRNQAALQTFFDSEFPHPSRYETQRSN